MRAVVAFAREVGTSVIAEGVETRGELEVLRDAEVHLVQGYLLARPGPPWPRHRSHRTVAVPAVGADRRGRAARTTTRSELRQALARVDNVLEACEIVVETLFRQGDLMSSLYLERNHELRCVAQRGLWQVLDGMPARRGSRDGPGPPGTRSWWTTSRPTPTTWRRFPAWCRRSVSRSSSTATRSARSTWSRSAR